MARILITTFGSYGDLYPYLAVGCELRNRNHEVTIGTSASFREKVEAAGLRFVPIRPDVDLNDREMLAYVFDAYRGGERVLRLISSVIRDTYEDTSEAARHCDLIVTHPITYAAVLVARKRKLPWASTVLAPLSMLSICDPPVLAPAPWLRHFRFPGLLRAVFWLGRKISRRWVRPVVELSEELGVPAGDDPVIEGVHSPSLVLALFSRLIAEPQPDWPRQTVVTGFPFYDENRGDEELEAFLDGGPAPVIFTLGSSAVGAAGAFYRESLQAVQRLRCRALFLTGSHEHGLPARMPEGVLAWPYAPHERVFPQASAIVHQGGIGTTAQALRSGRPTLVVPFAHDQFDNGYRVRRLGAGEVLHRTDYSARRAERLLRQLLEDRRYPESAVRASEVIRNENGAAAAADAIERTWPNLRALNR